MLRKITSVTYALIYLFILISLATGYNMLQSGDWPSILVMSPQQHPTLQPWVLHKQHALLVVTAVHSFTQDNIFMNQRRNRKSPYYIYIYIYIVCMYVCISIYLSIYPSIYLSISRSLSLSLSLQDPPNRGGRRHQGASPFYKSGDASPCSGGC